MAKSLELVFFQYVGKTPSLAGCGSCRLKFFTPQQLMRQPQAAAEYLREKFAVHTCKCEIVEKARVGTVQPRRLQIVKHTDDTSSQKATIPRAPRKTWQYFAQGVIQEENPGKLTYLMQQLYSVLKDEQTCEAAYRTSAPQSRTCESGQNKMAELCGSGLRRAGIG